MIKKRLAVLKKSFKKFIAKKLKIKFDSEFKKIIKNKILKNKGTLQKLEKIILILLNCV